MTYNVSSGILNPTILITYLYHTSHNEVVLYSLTYPRMLCL